MNNSKKQYFFIIVFSMLLMIFSLWLNLSAVNIDNWEAKSYKMRSELVRRNAVNQITIEDIELSPDSIQSKSQMINLSPLYTVIATLFFCLLTAFCAIYMQPLLHAGIASIASILTYPVFCLYLSVGFKLYIHMILPLCFLGITLLISFLLRWEIKNNRKQVAYKILGKFTSEQSVNNFLNDKSFLIPKIQNTTVMFSNVKNIKKLCEKYDEDAIISSLNYVYNVIIHAIQRNGGVVDKFVGNNITAYWIGNNHAFNAVKCSLDIKEKLDIIADMQPHIEIKTGIHTGDMLFGLIGTECVANYTPVGDSINFAYRLESSCAFYDVPILISKTTCERIKDKINTIKVGSMTVKSKNIQVEIYEPKGLL